MKPRRAHRADPYRDLPAGAFPYREAPPAKPLQDQRITILILAKPPHASSRFHPWEVLILDRKGRVVRRTATHGSAAQLQNWSRVVARALILDEGASQVEVRYGGVIARTMAWSKFDFLRGKLLRRYTAHEIKASAREDAEKIRFDFLPRDTGPWDDSG